MGYRIEYGPMPGVWKSGRKEPLRLQAMTAAFLLLFVIGVRFLYPEGTELLRNLLLPGEKTVTEAAFSGMLAQIRHGEPVGQAFTAFCQEIIDFGATTLN